MAIALNACHALGQEPAVDYDIHWLNRPDGLLRRSRARTDIIGKLIGVSKMPHRMLDTLFELHRSFGASKYRVATAADRPLGMPSPQGKRPAFWHLNNKIR